MNAKKQRLEKSIDAMKRQIAEMKTKRGQVYERITKVEAKKFSLVNDDFIVVRCETFDDMKQTLISLKPFKNGWKIEHAKTMHITSLYRVDIDNGAIGDSELKIQFENAGGIRYWVTLDVVKIPVTLFDKYLARTQRHPSSSERHYDRYHGMSDVSFNGTLIPAVTFRSVNVGWYGGDRTLVCEDTIKEMINDIKTYVP